MFGVLERLFVVHDSPTRLVLREYPLLAWLLGGSCITGAGMLWLLGTDISAVISIGVGVVILLWAQVRTVAFDCITGRFQVRLWSVLRRPLPLDMALTQVSRASVKTFDSGHTQIVMHVIPTGEMGLSVYSRDIADWKTPLVDRINTILA